MKVINGVGSLDFTLMAANEIVLAINPDDNVVRLWKRRGELHVSLPLSDEELTVSERAAVLQHKLEMGATP